MSTYVRDDDDRAQTLREVMALRDATIEEMEKVIEQRNRMCSDYFEGHTTNMKRIEELEGDLNIMRLQRDAARNHIEELEGDVTHLTACQSELIRQREELRERVKWLEVNWCNPTGE